MDEGICCSKQTDIKKFENEIKLFKFWYEKRKMKGKEKFDFYYGNNSNDIILKPSDLKKMPMSSMTLND